MIQFLEPFFKKGTVICKTTECITNCGKNYSSFIYYRPYPREEFIWWIISITKYRLVSDDAEYELTTQMQRVSFSTPLKFSVVPCYAYHSGVFLLHRGVSEAALNNMLHSPLTVYPKKYAHGFVVLCFVVVMQSFIMNSHKVFIHINQGCFAGTGAIVRLPQCQWSKPYGYGKISQYITTTKHSEAKTVCIFLGIYCKFVWMFDIETTKQSTTKPYAFGMGNTLCYTNWWYSFPTLALDFS